MKSHVLAHRMLLAWSVGLFLLAQPWNFDLIGTNAITLATLALLLYSGALGIPRYAKRRVVLFTGLTYLLAPNLIFSCWLILHTCFISSPITNPETTIPLSGVLMIVCAVGVFLDRGFGLSDFLFIETMDVEALDKIVKKALLETCMSNNCPGFDVDVELRYGGNWLYFTSRDPQYQHLAQIASEKINDAMENKGWPQEWDEYKVSASTEGRLSDAVHRVLEPDYALIRYPDLSAHETLKLLAS